MPHPFSSMLLPLSPRQVSILLKTPGGDLRDVTSLWTFDFFTATESIVVNECKIHNDASVDIAVDSSILAALVPSHRTSLQIRDGTMLGIYSLREETLGQCLHIWSFGREAITVSLSPLARYVMVGLASCRITVSPLDRTVMLSTFCMETINSLLDYHPV